MDTLVQLAIVVACVVAVPLWAFKPRRTAQTVQGRPVAQRRRRAPALRMASPAAELLYILSQYAAFVVFHVRAMRLALQDGWRSVLPVAVMSPPVEVAPDPVPARLEVAGSTEVEVPEVTPTSGSGSVSDRQMRALAEYVDRKAAKKEIPDQLVVDLLGVNNKAGFAILKGVKEERAAVVALAQPVPEARAYPVIVKGCETPLPTEDETRKGAKAQTKDAA